MMLNSKLSIRDFVGSYGNGMGVGVAKLLLEWCTHRSAPSRSY